MRIYDIIEKKRDGGKLTDAEIKFFVDGYVAGRIPDYQISALLMAIFLRGMDDEETTQLTLHMMHSGDVVDLSSLPGVTVDKHSTGGVGDKTSLAVVPILAAMDPGHIFVAKMSGRGLGHTGGTLDKLESIPGFNISIAGDDFLALVREHGGAIVGQTGNLVPADKLIYALRDVTATVDSIPLIASSIMSKKLAAGSNCILLDVKVGSGAFMKTVPDAVKLAQSMVAIGTGAGRKVEALITNMDRPLGHAIGNSMEVAEVIATLHGEGPDDLTHECIMLSSRLAALTGRFSLDEAEKRAKEVLANGAALAKLHEIVAAQGGDARYINDPSLFEDAPVSLEVHAPHNGFIGAIDTEKVGIASAELGAGRLTLDDDIDHRAGISLLRNYGDAVSAGDTVAVLHATDESKLSDGLATFTQAITYTEQEPERKPLLFAIVNAEGVHYMDDSRGQA